MFKGSYLRVLTPVTTNGVNPVILENGQIKYTESHLDIRAKSIMEKKNARLPAHLKHKIDVIEINPTPAPQQIATNETKQLTAAEIREQLRNLSEDEIRVLIDEVDPDGDDGVYEMNENAAKRKKKKTTAQ